METVTRQEMANAMEGLKGELLEEVKTTAAAQMAQTLSESGLEGMSSEQLARLGLLAEHGPGICSDDHCSHCEKDRIRFRQEGEALASKAKRTLFAELAQAAQWGGVVDEANQVALTYERWQTEGKPDGVEAPVPAEEQKDAVQLTA